MDLIGKTLSHYVILDQIGAGGMGVVYRARDERLDRDVALKVLASSLVADEAARKRLHREAHLLSRLNHHNINQIYDFDTQDGVDFLVMEFVRGETLSHRLRSACFPEPEVVSIGVQIAQALEEAHASGIVHRDLKPGNVMLTARGTVKVLDFGLAKALQSDHVATEGLTEAGGVAGTLPYIAPEQFRGAPVDERSDIYALGAVLYEIITGVRAFPQETAASLVDAVLHQPPPSPRTLVPEVSPALEAVILRSLEKDPARRPSTAGEVATALQSTGTTQVATRYLRGRRPRPRTIALTLAAITLLGLGYAFSPWLRGGPHATGSGPIDALAVLPLDDLSGDPEQGYFADGMTDALITKLAQIGGLRVISRTSVMHYRDSGKTMKQIAKELHVDAVVEGTVLRSGNHVRISAQLVDASADRHLWADTYERDLGDVIALQRDLATAIAGQVHVQLTARERKSLEHAPRVVPAAYDEYLKGRHEWATRTRDGLERARGHFSNAAEADPNFALAYSGLAEVYLLQDIYSGSRAEEALPRAEEAARRALAIDDQLGEAYPALGMVKLYRRWDWSGAEADFKRAIQLRPSYATAHHWYSILLRDRGRFDESIAEARRALELDPLSLIVNANLGDAYFFAGRYPESIRQHRLGRNLDPNFAPTHLYLAMAFAQNGEIDSAIVSCETARKLAGSDSYALGGLGFIMARAGRRLDAERILAELSTLEARGQAVPFDIGLVWAGLGSDRAIEWIDKARKQQPSGIKDLGVDPRFNALRGNPRFRAILHQIGLG